VRNERHCVNKAFCDLYNVPTTVRELEVKGKDVCVSITSQLVLLLLPKIVILAALHIWLWRDGKTQVDKESEVTSTKLACK
jgi:hypothetical protein